MLAAREEQWEVEEQRRELLVLLKSAAKLAFPEALNFVAGKLQAVLAAGQAAAGSSGQTPGSSSGANSSGASFQDAEVAVTLLYELGEGAPDDALKPGSGGLGQLVLLLLTQGQALPAGQHRLVALAVLETCVRYCRVLQQEQSAIPAVLSLFLGPKGLGHPSPDVATRACYLLSRLVKTLRSNLKPYMDEMLRQLQPYLVVIATQPPPQGPAVGSCREASGKNLAPLTALVDDRLYVFESVGLLLGQEELPAEQQLAALHSLLQPLQRQIEANLQRAAAEAGAGSSGSGGGLGGAAQLGSGSWAILQAMEAIARLNKGFKWELCTRNRPQLGEREDSLLLVFMLGSAVNYCHLARLLVLQIELPVFYAVDLISKYTVPVLCAC
jgi:exportin-T